MPLFLINWASISDVDAINDDHLDVETLGSPNALLIEAPTWADALACAERRAQAEWQDFYGDEDCDITHWERTVDGSASIARTATPGDEFGWAYARPTNITSHDEDLTQELMS